VAAKEMAVLDGEASAEAHPRVLELRSKVHATRPAPARGSPTRDGDIQRRAGLVGAAGCVVVASVPGTRIEVLTLDSPSPRLSRMDDAAPTHGAVGAPQTSWIKST